MRDKIREKVGTKITQDFRNDFKRSFFISRVMGSQKGFKHGSGNQTYVTETSGSG